MRRVVAIALTGALVAAAAVFFASADVTAARTAASPKTLLVGKTGTGSGSVSSRPGGIRCGSTCSSRYGYGTRVALHAAPAAGSTFVRWSGACSGSGACTVRMTAKKRVVATFAPSQKTLTVWTGGVGSGRVFSTPAGISCGSACSKGFVLGTTVTLRAAPAANSRFVGWSGDCSGAGSCTVAMTVARNVTATFAIGPTRISTAPTAPLRTAVADPWTFRGGELPVAFHDIAAAGATWVRLDATWAGFVPVRLPASGFDQADPGSPYYHWARLDATVAAAVAHGLTPMLDLYDPPQWALTVPPSGRNAGTPSVTALQKFARAIATHYDGHHGVPAVHAFEVWNEPNLSLELSPVSATVYRSMINAVAASVHAVDPANLVVAGELDPFTNNPSNWHSEAPLTFMRELLCVSAGTDPRPTCNAPVRFDVWAHHPYTFTGPFGHARFPNDVSLGDLPKMKAVLDAAVRLHHVVSADPPQFWVTEFGWDTNPPRAGAAPPDLEARWTAEALYQMWTSGVSLATWFMLQDQPAPSPYQSGIYFGGVPLARAQPKPMLTAFRFPFVAYLQRDVSNRLSVSVWGRNATSTPVWVTIQRQQASTGAWTTVASILANSNGIFQGKFTVAGLAAADSLRAVAAGSGASLPFSLTVPPAQRYGPWGN